MPAVSLPEWMYFTLETSMGQDLGTVVDRTDDGAPALRDLYSQTRFNIDAKFSVVTREQLQLLRAFFWNNRAAEILVNLNGAVYACYVVGEVRTSFSTSAGRGTVAVDLLGREVTP